MRWFHRLRARAVSFTVAGTSLGTAAVYPLVASVEHFGWRDTLFGMGVMIWVVGFATVATLRPNPERYARASVWAGSATVSAERGSSLQASF